MSSSQSLETGGKEAKSSPAKKRECLDINLFIEALALCAFQSKSFERDGDPIERIIHLMQKITQSPGVTKVKKAIGNTRY